MGFRTPTILFVSSHLVWCFKKRLPIRQYHTSRLFTKFCVHIFNILHSALPYNRPISVSIYVFTHLHYTYLSGSPFELPYRMARWRVRLKGEIEGEATAYMNYKRTGCCNSGLSRVLRSVWIQILYRRIGLIIQDEVRQNCCS